MKSDNKGKVAFSEDIKRQALNIGFDACAITRAEIPASDAAHFKKYLDEGRHAGMEYLERNYEKMVNPSLVLESAKSVIIVLLNYYPSHLQNPECNYRVAKYAYGRDYHLVISAMLRELEAFIQKNAAVPVSSRCFVDSSAVMEKALALQSGLGWRGKNSLVLNRQLGSFFFIGEIILDLELDYDEPMAENLCGTCSACMDACPTRAITEAYRLDAGKCISYHNIEERKELSAPLNNHGWIYGCDICQDVCPWNKKLSPAKTVKFKPVDEIINFSSEDWQNMDEATFDSLFRESPIRRIKYAGLQRNLKNAGK